MNQQRILKAAPLSTTLSCPPRMREEPFRPVPARPLPTEEPTPFRRRAKERLTVTLPVDLLDRLRNAVSWTPHLTLARLIQESVTQYVDALEEKNGQPFPQRMQELKGGRPRQIRPDSIPV